MSQAETNHAAESAEPEVSIIVPTLNEAENLPDLLARVDAALTGRSYQVIVVDDNSRDDTPAVCQKLAGQFPLQLLIRRQAKNGLSGAVLHGMARARGRYFAVMDADLQHPPERLPDLLQPLIDNTADFVIGSRYVSGGSTEATWSLFRQLNSKVATLLARPFAGHTTDPMSGFFALRRESYQNARQLTPLGYKIALELMCKGNVNRVREIPIHFGNRQHGRSKLSIKQQFRYLEHLSRLYDFKYPRAAPVAKFLIGVGLAGFVALGFFLILLRWTGPAAAMAIAYPSAIAMTALLHLRYVRTQCEFLIRPRPWLDFAIISLCEWIACALTALWIARRINQPRIMEYFALSFAAAIVVRYILRKEFLQDIRGLAPGRH